MRTIERLLVVALLVATGIALAPGAGAKGGDVIRTGVCSGAAHWKLKLSPDNGRIEVEFQVDTNKIGRAWHVRIRHNGVLIFVGKRVTMAPSGAFTVRRLTNNRAGTDSFRAGARAAVSGQTCVGRASIG
jgi:hypothetical protein